MIQGQPEFKQNLRIEGNLPSIQPFSLLYDSRFNIYLLKDSSFANRLVELHLASKLPKHVYPQFSWYLHPEEALYLVSVMDPFINLENKTAEKIRSQSIKQIYKSSQPKDISILHFYLSVRKKNKFLRRVDKFELELSEGKQECEQEMDDMKVFKIYELKEDFKMDTCYRYVLVVEPEQLIADKIFGERIQKWRKEGNERMKICIISNNDWVLLEMKN